ncbi:hypothetical protein R1flu_002595 [Riccia fluitans]|uniref:Uncharacterized protein n=1 Tax=Riccia fluitans TaxID=41844 RepID=A0ABD1Y6R0_9MARC
MKFLYWKTSDPHQVLGWWSSEGDSEDTDFRRRFGYVPYHVKAPTVLAPLLSLFCAPSFNQQKCLRRTWIPTGQAEEPCMITSPGHLCDGMRMQRGISTVSSTFRLEQLTPGGVTVIIAHRDLGWRKGILTFVDANVAGKVNLVQGMRDHGSVGVVNYSGGGSYESSRIDMTLFSVLSSWILSKTSDRVKSIADKIMSRYSDEKGRPGWTPPVLTVFTVDSRIRKREEDPFWIANGRNRNASEYLQPMRELEEYGFEWSTVFLMSDSGTLLNDISAEINGRDDGVSDPLSAYFHFHCCSQEGWEDIDHIRLDFRYPYY